jgi:hypothetical protein
MPSRPQNRIHAFRWPHYGGSSRARSAFRAAWGWHQICPPLLRARPRPVNRKIPRARPGLRKRSLFRYGMETDYTRGVTWGIVQLYSATRTSNCARSRIELRLYSRSIISGRSNVRLAASSDDSGLAASGLGFVVFVFSTRSWRSASYLRNFSTARTQLCPGALHREVACPAALELARHVIWFAGRVIRSEALAPRLITLRDHSTVMGRRPIIVGNKEIQFCSTERRKPVVLPLIISGPSNVRPWEKKTSHHTRTWRSRESKICDEPCSTRRKCHWDHYSGTRTHWQAD